MALSRQTFTIRTSLLILLVVFLVTTASYAHILADALSGGMGVTGEERAFAPCIYSGKYYIIIRITRCDMVPMPPLR